MENAFFYQDILVILKKEDFNTNCSETWFSTSSFILLADLMQKALLRKISL